MIQGTTELDVLTVSKAVASVRAADRPSLLPDSLGAGAGEPAVSRLADENKGSKDSILPAILQHGRGADRREQHKSD